METISFTDFMNQVIEDLKKEERYGTAYIYGYALRAFCLFAEPVYILIQDTSLGYYLCPGIAQTIIKRQYIYIYLLVPFTQSQYQQKENTQVVTT